MTEHAVDSDTGYVETAIPLRESTVCTLTVQVANDSDRSIALGRVTVPIGGPGAKSGFEITMIAGRKVASGDEIDASVALDLTVGPHESQFVDFQVVSRGDGCDSPDSYTSVEPTIHLSRLLGSRDLRVADFPLFEGTNYTSCDR